MEIENIEVYGFKAALRGMRNPMNSWEKSDSSISNALYQSEYLCEASSAFNIETWIIGENDIKLAQSLIKAGTEHSKFMRQIQVWADITAPRYWWSEFDTYKVGVSANSTSTMHKLFDKKKEITLDLFETAGLGEAEINLLNATIDYLMGLRQQYFETKSATKQNLILRNAKCLLPESYLNTRSVNMNYQNLRNMVLQRRFHRLSYEWQQVYLGQFVCSLPYARELIFCGIEEDYDRLNWL